MFSTGHLMWIGISVALIVFGMVACLRRKPSEEHFLKICLAIGITSEAVKLFSVMRILPMVDIAVNGVAEVTVDYSTVREYLTSPRIYQFFLYHSMVVTLGLYMGFGPDSDVSLHGYKETMGLLLAMDVPTFYLNSVFSQPVYVAGKPEGIVYRTNFFSSYVNPLGLVLTQRWQWLAYLAIRLAIAAVLIAFLLLLPSRRQRNRY